ncbi:MAG TPA: hypothetical protein VF516_07315 [Kofleriaceae bacterium]
MLVEPERRLLLRVSSSSERCAGPDLEALPYGFVLADRDEIREA